MKNFAADLLLAGTASANLAIPTLISQTVNVDQNVVQLAANGVTVAVLVWYVVFDVRIRTPKMIRAFQEEQEKARETFIAQERENREHYRSVLKEVRSSFLEEQKYERDAFAALGLRYDREMEALRSMFYQVMKEMYAANHDVKNTDGSAGLGMPVTTIQSQEKK